MIFRDKTKSFIIICHDMSWIVIVLTCHQPIQRGNEVFLSTKVINMQAVSSKGFLNDSNCYIGVRFYSLVNLWYIYLRTRFLLHLTFSQYIKVITYWIGYTTCNWHWKPLWLGYIRLWQKWLPFLWMCLWVQLICKLMSQLLKIILKIIRITKE